MDKIFGTGPKGQRIARWIAWGLAFYIVGLLIGAQLVKAGILVGIRWF